MYRECLYKNVYNLDHIYAYGIIHIHFCFRVFREPQMTFKNHRISENHKLPSKNLNFLRKTWTSFREPLINFENTRMQELDLHEIIIWYFNWSLIPITKGSVEYFFLNKRLEKYFKFFIIPGNTPRNLRTLLWWIKQQQSLDFKNDWSIGLNLDNQSSQELLHYSDTNFMSQNFYDPYEYQSSIIKGRNPMTVMIQKLSQQMN